MKQTFHSVLKSFSVDAIILPQLLVLHTAATGHLHGGRNLRFSHCNLGVQTDEFVLLSSGCLPLYKAVWLPSWAQRLFPFCSYKIDACCCQRRHDFSAVLRFLLSLF
uniref:Putative secreted protein n=1 Tax=Rhipicephalus microplus TaxID=6941 RepID=A0A6M2D928_RHIMP